MGNLDFIDPTSDEYFDVLVEVEFAKPLAVGEIVTLAQTIGEILTGRLAQVLFEYLSRLELDERGIKMQFRFYHNHQLHPDLVKVGDPSMLRMQFIFFVFASIDAIYPLGDVPFPPDFREFIKLSEYVL